MTRCLSGSLARAARVSLDPPVVAEGLERHFGDVKAVDGVDLVVNQGEIFGFLGPNGAGKSTTVRMLATLLTPTAGSARVAGYDVVRDAAMVRRNIGVALQDAAIDPIMTGRELPRAASRAVRDLEGPRQGRGATSCSIVSGSPAPRTGGWAPTRAACAGVSTSRCR